MLIATIIFGLISITAGLTLVYVNKNRNERKASKVWSEVGSASRRITRK